MNSTIETTKSQTISFYGSDLVTLQLDNVIYAAVKPIVEAIGLDWGRQAKKLSQQEKFGCRHMSIPTKGGVQEMICMPIKKLNGWLFSINPEKVRPDLKAKVIQYQEECFEALYHYWHFGKAERKTTTDERTGLRQAVSALVSKKGLIYSDAYSMIHQRFNVEHIDELTAEQIPLAVEYVHKIYLEGELIIDPEPTDLPKTVHWSWQNIHTMSWMWFSHGKLTELLEDLLPALEAMKSSYSAKAYSHVHEYRRLYKGAKPLIEQLLEGCEMDKTNSHNLNVVLRKLQELNAPPPPVRRLAHRF